MKTRNNSSKAFHNSEMNTSKTKSFLQLVDRITAKIDTAKDQKLAMTAFREIIQRCYNNKAAQQQLCQAMTVPFIAGPVSLNTIPYSFFQQEYLSSNDVQTNVMNQIQYLFEYLKKTKEYFYCWIIYYNEELKLLSVKMMKKYEIKENIELLNSKYCLIGIFVHRQVNLSTKKQPFPQISTKETQKLSAYSCYQRPVKLISEKPSKSKNTLKKTVQKITNSESVYSLKTLKSASKTNSSSFKNEKSSKESEIYSDQNPIYEVMSNEKIQKPKNFKKKKAKLTHLAQTKIRKSLSIKFEGIKSPVRIMKSLQKIDFGVKKHSPRSFKSQQKLPIFRSISNTQKMMKNVKNPQFMNSNKIQLQKFKKGSKDSENLVEKGFKRPPSLIKNKSLSKSSKIYSSCGSLNVTTESKGGFIKEPQEKLPTTFIKRKISSNISSSFKNKKLTANSIKFNPSSKNSFNIQ